MALAPLELWGGVECTMARIRDEYRDQSVETGHRTRVHDLEAIRQLGVKTLRYPVLWEAVSPDQADECDWRWPDVGLNAIQKLGIRPIVGLLHHGSGPRYTSLLDPDMPIMLARHARRVAARYPWVDCYTPVNEPLTTARFSTLYGHWYPHRADERSFVWATYLQCKAVALAMIAIRQINPAATLIQTEDIGKTFATAALADQAAYENGRRWLSLDLLCGKIDVHHDWHARLVGHGVPESELELFLGGDAAPDVIGVNHYLTSERYLDEDLAPYPDRLHGGNGRQAFADVEAVRVDLSREAIGPAARLREVWARYELPIAVTEVHHGCTRDEQIRWLITVWNAALEVRLEGVNVRAVTVWALFGAVDWNSLLTERNQYYEPGAFDVRAPTPRLTAVGQVTNALATYGAFDHPVLDTAGWWRRSDRFYQSIPRPREEVRQNGVRRLLITSATTPLARTFARICELRGLPYTFIDHPEAGGSAEGPNRLLDNEPWALIDASPDDRKEDGPQAQSRAASSERWARWSADRNLPFVVFSSSRVFDGRLGRSYVESDKHSPVDVFGRLCASIETQAATLNPKVLIIRTGMLLNAWDGRNLGAVIRALEREVMPPLPEALISTSYAPDLAHATLDLLIDGETGIWHLTNPGKIGLSELAARLAKEASSTLPVLAIPSKDMLNFSLASHRGWPMPNLDNALVRFARDRLIEGTLFNARMAAE